MLDRWYYGVLDTIQLGFWENNAYAMGAEELTMYSFVIGDAIPALLKGLELGHE